MAQTRQNIEKRFSASLKGVQNEALPVKNLAFKIFILSFENSPFLPNLKKNKHV